MRPDVEHHFLALRERSLVGERLPRHQPRQDIEVLVEAVALFLGVAVVADELVREIARTDAEHQAPAAHQVEHRVGLGEAARIVEGEDRDRCAQANALGALRQCRQHDRRIGHHPVFMEMVLGTEESVVSQVLGHLAVAHHLAIQFGDGARQMRVVVVYREQ